LKCSNIKSSGARQAVDLETKYDSGLGEHRPPPSFNVKNDSSISMSEVTSVGIRNSLFSQLLFVRPLTSSRDRHKAPSASSWTLGRGAGPQRAPAAGALVTSPPRMRRCAWLWRHQKKTPLCSVPNCAKLVCVVAGSDSKWKPCPVSGGVVTETAIVAEHSKKSPRNLFVASLKPT
jgi:hypothetical protein